MSQEDIQESLETTLLFENKVFPPMTVVDQLSTLPYRRSGVISTNCHIGQRKLLMNEILFYTQAKEYLTIYAGSAGGEHTDIILGMFPYKKYIFIDPNYHNLNVKYTYLYQNPAVIDPNNRKMYKRLNTVGARSLSQAMVYKRDKVDVLSGMNDNLMTEHMKFFKTSGYKSMILDILKSNIRVFIIQDYLTPELIGLLSEAMEMFEFPFNFVSDIRSVSEGSRPVDMDYVVNDTLNALFIKKLQPSTSMLKFHPPYYDDDSIKPDTTNPYIDELRTLYGIDMLANYRQGLHMYFDASRIYLQPWAPIHSSETRMIVTKEDSMRSFVNYDHSEWDDRFFYLRKLRMYGYFGLWSGIVSGYDASFDSTLELYILSSYLGVDINASTSKKIAELAAVINKNQSLKPKNDVCGFRGQITKPLISPIMFTVKDGGLYKIINGVVSPVNTSDVNEARIALNTVGTTASMDTLKSRYEWKKSGVQE